MTKYATGWFGVPGRQGGQVHLLKDGKALCGLKPHPRAEFFCNAESVVYEWVECKRCQEWAWPLHLDELVAVYQRQLKENAHKAYWPQSLRDNNKRHILRQLSAVQALIASGAKQ